MPELKPGERVVVTSSEDKTYTSENLQSFFWRKDSDYKYGKLFVVFQNSPTVYMYDVEWKVFVEMARRAYHPEDYKRSPFKWYDSELVNWVGDRTHPDKDVLYREKHTP